MIRITEWAPRLPGPLAGTPRDQTFQSPHPWGVRLPPGMSRRALITFDPRTRVGCDADAVEIRPSDLSEAARRGEVSLVWLITLMEKYRASPVWLLSGEGETYLPSKLSAAQKRALLREIIARLEDMAKQWRHSPLLEEERKLRELRDKKVYLSAASDAEAEQAE